MATTALIFGGTGQDGAYLSRLLEAEGVRVVPSSRSSMTRPGDVADFDFVDAIVREVRPDYVFHLAASSTASHDAWRENLGTVSAGVWNVCEAALRHCPEARVFVTGSGLQFENDGGPIDERTPFRASSPYSVARIHSVYTARYFRTRGLRTYVGYLFHHDSPLRGPDHLSMRIAQAAVEIAAGRRSELAIGDVHVEKEWGFAGDVAAAIWTLVSQDVVWEAVIGTGQARPIADWVECCFERVGVDWRRHVVTGDFRPEFGRLVSAPERMRALGWESRVGIHELADMVMRSLDPAPGAPVSN